MNHTVWKFPFKLDDVVHIEMPQGAQILHWDVQPEVGPCLWALVDPAVPKNLRHFYVAGTGAEIPPQYVSDRGCGAGLQFINTQLLHGGTLVFHLFEFTP